MHIILSETQPLALIASTAIIIVIIAMIIDLAAGLHKAKINNLLRSSWALKRTVTKFISYIGSLLIALGIDIIIHLSGIHSIISLKSLKGIPIVTCTLAVFLLIVEIISIRETADDKTLRQQNEAADLIRKILSLKHNS